MPVQARDGRYGAQKVAAGRSGGEQFSSKSIAFSQLTTITGESDNEDHSDAGESGDDPKLAG